MWLKRAAASLLAGPLAAKIAEGDSWEELSRRCRAMRLADPVLARVAERLIQNIRPRHLAAGFYPVVRLAP